MRELEHLGWPATDSSIGLWVVQVRSKQHRLKVNSEDETRNTSKHQGFGELYLSLLHKDPREEDF